MKFLRMFSLIPLHILLLVSIVRAALSNLQRIIFNTEDYTVFLVYSDTPEA